MDVKVVCLVVGGNCPGAEHSETSAQMLHCQRFHTGEMCRLGLLNLFYSVVAIRQPKEEDFKS